MNREVAFFKNCRSRKGGRNVSLSEFLNGTKNGKWSAAVTELRRVPLNSADYDTLKRNLPCFMLSASTATGGHKATDIKQHSGLLQLDIDGRGEFEAAELRDRLAGDPHVLAAWISPGGAGVKGILLCSCDPAQHREAFNAACAYFSERYGVQMDQKCSDPCRLCFVSFDPDLRLSLKAIPLPLPESKPAPTATAAPAPSQGASSSSLPTASASCILHNAGDLFGDYPALRPIYDQQVLRRLGTPQRGLRNSALVELVAGTFCVVNPKFVLGFSDAFYRHHGELFSDYPKEQWMKEARSVLNGCLADYPKKQLGAGERERYQELTDDQYRTAFRICRSLAACASDPAVLPPDFYLSASQLAARLGVLDMKAWRIMQDFERMGILKTTKKGTRRKAGQKSTATHWRWCLPPGLPLTPSDAWMTVSEH